MTEKIDLKKELKHLYAPSAKAVAAVDVPPLNYLMIDGVGDPNTRTNTNGRSLYALAYALKFKIQKAKQNRLCRDAAQGLVGGRYAPV